MLNPLFSSSIVFMKQITCTIITLGLSLFFVAGIAQPGAEIEVNKPERYENRKLGAEKTGEKKFTIPRRILQNTTTHYNYYFNANNRLNDIILNAKAAHKDDYSQLLPFYNYSLETTSQDKVELDSIIYKSTAGILLHDLRNDWIDNMYLLLAKAYFFRNDLDSAGLTLQYINYAFAPKEDGYDIPIGSNASNETGEFSIVSKENKGIKKIITHQPSRNESFLWQVKTLIEKNEMPEASGILEILRDDPNFPPRLRTEMNETMAYWFYKQKLYDSSAYYLRRALNEADNGQEKARWEYLIAQMYHLSEDYENAIAFYDRSIKHTIDPVMDVYARLNSIKINRGDDKDYLQKNIDALTRMAKRDKYENYRDIIYFAAASIELERNNFDNAQNFLLKSVATSKDNPLQKNQSFLLLGDLNYNRKKYAPSYAFYDSVDVTSLSVIEQQERVNTRKPPLQVLAENEGIIYKNDSLQMLAKLPEDQRDAILRKLVKSMRKSQGLKDEEVQTSNPAVRQAAPDLFGSNSKNNEFYFYNASQKASGFNDFRSKWGDRPNIDNWRRQSAVNKRSAMQADVDQPINQTLVEVKEPATSFEGLLLSLPLTEEAMKENNKSIMEALFANGKILSDKLEDYPSAILVYEELLRRFPGNPNADEAMFNLIYAYDKTGDIAKAAATRKALLQNSPNSKFATILKNPAPGKNSPEQNAATSKYKDIYNLFIEGNFEQAKNEKRIADSLYGNSNWTPQLLYIEAIYYVKQREDSTAIRVLTNLQTLHPDSELAPKAKIMVDVLKRRTEIENYLTNLEVNASDRQLTNSPKQNTTPANPSPAIPKPVAPVSGNVKDTLPKAKVPDVKPNVPVMKDTVSAVVKPTVVKDFSFIAADQHFVVVLLDKVNDVYVSEAGNAFNRYNREVFYNQKITISPVKIDDRYNMVLQGPFDNAAAAIAYIDKVKPVTKGRILPWLDAAKYSFIVISNANLELLKTNKDMDAYQQLIRQAFPDKF